MGVGERGGKEKRKKEGGGGRKKLTPGFWYRKFYNPNNLDKRNQNYIYVTFSRLTTTIVVVPQR